MSGTDDIHPRGDGAEAPWTRADFEAAIPLFVGGDLDPADAERVERWIAAHPEDAAVVRAADEARSVLLAHGRRFERRETPDLLPGIREELARLKGGMARVSGRRAAGSDGDAEALPSLAAGSAPARRRSWLERPALAAAAAVLFVGTLGLGIARIGAPVPGAVPRGAGGSTIRPVDDGVLSGSDRAADRFAGASRPASSAAAITGTDERPLDVTPVGATAPRRVVPLRPTGGDAEHLLPSATPVHHWFPSLDLSVTPATDNGVRLTTGRR